MMTPTEAFDWLFIIWLGGPLLVGIAVGLIVWAGARR